MTFEWKEKFCEREKREKTGGGGGECLEQTTIIARSRIALMANGKCEISVCFLEKTST